MPTTLTPTAVMSTDATETRGSRKLAVDEEEQISSTKQRVRRYSETPMLLPAVMDQARASVQLTKWMDHPLQELFVTFDLPGTKQQEHGLLSVAMLKKVGTSWIVGAVAGLVLSLGFALSVPRPQGVPGLSDAEKRLSGFTLSFSAVGVACGFAFMDPELMTWQWYVWCQIFNTLPFFVTRTVIEIYAPQLDFLSIVALTYLAYLIFMVTGVVPQALYRLTNRSNSWGYANPLPVYKWLLGGGSLEVWKAKVLPLLKTELVGFITMLFACVASVFIILADSALLANPNVTFPPALRPIVLAILKRMIYSFLAMFTLSKSNFATFRSMGPMPMHFIINFLTVVTAAGSKNWGEFGVFCLVDWMMFTWRVHTYWYANSPKRATFSTGFLRYLTAMTFNKPVPFPGTVKHQYRSSEMYAESLAVSAAYIGTMLGYGYFKAAGLGPENVGFAFWFPYGEQSLIYLGIGYASELVQDITTHAAVHLHNARIDKDKCEFTRVFDGYLTAFNPADRPGFLYLLQICMVPVWVPTLATWLAYGKEATSFF